MKRGRGRPAKAPEDLKSGKIVSYRVDEAVARDLLKRAKKGESLSQVARRLALEALEES